MSDDKLVRSEIVEAIGPWLNMVGKFEAKHPLVKGWPANVNVELDIPRFCIDWQDKDVLMQELAQVINRYRVW